MTNPTTALEIALKLVTALDEAVILPGEIEVPDLDEVRAEIEAALSSMRQQPEVLSGAEVYKRIRTTAEAAPSVAGVARAMGVTKQHLSDVIAGRKEPGPAVLRYMRLRKVIRGDVYVHSDVEPPAPPRPISERHQRARDMLPRLPKSVVPTDAGMGVSP